MRCGTNVWVHSLLLLMLEALCGFGSAIWQKRGLDVPNLQRVWGDGLLQEGTSVCSEHMCRGWRPCSPGSALEVAMHIPDTHK